MLMIQKDSFLEVCKMFLTNKNKGNLLASTILSLFESISQLMPPDFLKKLMKRFVQEGYHKSIFLNPLFVRDFKRFNYLLN
jgi:hypothetical protein